MMDKETDEAIQVLIDKNCEHVAIRQLTNSIYRKLAEAEWESTEMRSALRTIKKLNDGKIEVIDALCEEPKEQKRFKKEMRYRDGT